MKLNITDALSILGITPENTHPDAIKEAYRKAAQKYHPDRNPAGLEMMKLINAAYAVLRDFKGVVDTAKVQTNYGEEINAALNAIMGLGLTIEICGAWIWIGGDTKAHKDELKAANFKWSPKKSLWYFRPDSHKSSHHKSWSMEQIYSRYGRNVIKDDQSQIQAA